MLRLLLGRDNSGIPGEPLISPYDFLDVGALSLFRLDHVVGVACDV